MKKILLVIFCVILKIAHNFSSLNVVYGEEGINREGLYVIPRSVLFGDNLSSFDVKGARHEGNKLNFE